MVVHPLILFMALLLAFFGATEQVDPPLEEADTVAILKASYLFKFATSSDWPAEVKKGPFKIAVLGSDAVFRELMAKYATKPIGSQELEVHLLQKPDFSEYYHVVYVAGEAADLMKRVAKSSSGKATLLVADGKENVKHGAVASFVVIDNTTRYIINFEEAQKRKVSLGSTIILWAVSN